MVGLFYPVAASADAAMGDLNLNILQCAACESEARHTAGGEVIFKSEFAGDPFAEGDEALRGCTHWSGGRSLVRSGRHTHVRKATSEKAACFEFGSH